MGTSDDQFQKLQPPLCDELSTLMHQSLISLSKDGIQRSRAGLPALQGALNGRPLFPLKSQTPGLKWIPHALQVYFVKTNIIFFNSQYTICKIKELKIT